MDKLEVAYNKYKQDKLEADNKAYHYQLTLENSRKELSDALTEESLLALNKLGYPIDIDVDRLEDKGYLTDKLEAINKLVNEVEEKAIRILERRED